MAKKRVHELAKEMGRTNREVMESLKELGIDVKSHMSSVEEIQAEKVKEKFKLIGKEQNVESPNNEKNVNKQEETPKKKKNIIRVYHAQNASDGGRKKPQGERKKTERKPLQGRPQQGGNRPAQGSGTARPQGDRPAESRENSSYRENNSNYRGRQGGAHPDGQGRPQNRSNGEGRPYQNRQGGSRPDGQGRPQSRNNGEGRPYQNRQGGSRPDGQGRPQNRSNGEGRPYQNRQGGSRPDGQGRPQNRNNGEGRPYQNRQGGSRPDGQGRPQGRGGNTGSRPPRRQEQDSVFATEITKPSKEGKRERDNKKDNKKKEYEKNSRRPNQGGRRPNSRLPKALQKPAPQQKQEEKKPEIKEITLPEKLTIRELAEKMKMQPSVIVKKLFLEGIMVTVNHEVDFEKAQEIALSYDIIAEEEEKVDVIEELLKEEEEDESTLQPRPPVVCVMGHVDHGKTSLLDAIRNTNVTDREAGGITQHIGAYVVQINGQKITFLDTPGHEAFTAMRMRGANATDIAILVVAADDGVMPQTVEAISHAKAAGIEIIVAINKIDKPSANVERVKQELSEYELIPEDWGGSTVFVPVSAHTGEGIDSLLEMILLTAEVSELKANPRRAARGLVIEAELDKGKGPVATILVQKGTLHVGDFIAAGASSGKVRAMMDDKGRRVKEAGPSTPVEILGLSDVPNAGEILVAFDSDKEAKNFASTFVSENKNRLLEDTKAKLSLDDLFSQIQAGNLKELPIIVKADVQGSVEAVKQSLTKLSNEEVVVKVIHGGVGAINESDVTLAATSNAIVIGFNVRPDAMAKQLAEQEGVDLRLYRVIYQAIEDVEAAMKGMLDPIFEEKVIGHAEVRQLFKASGVGTIAGSYVLDGIFQRGCKVRITREGEQIYEGALASLKRFKDDVKEVKAGYECGLVFEDFNDVKEEDQVEAYTMVEVPR